MNISKSRLRKIYCYEEDLDLIIQDDPNPTADCFYIVGHTELVRLLARFKTPHYYPTDYETAAAEKAAESFLAAQDYS